MGNDEKLIAALRHYASSGRRLPFPYDNRPTVLKMAADRLEAECAAREERDAQRLAFNPPQNRTR